MKKNTLILGTVFFLVLTIVGIGQFIIRKQVNFNLPTSFLKEQIEPSPTLFVVSTPIPQVETVIVDFGDGTKLTEEVSVKNAYEALEKIAKDKNLNVSTKQYKFGLMVEKIGQKANSNEYAWSYSVNGKLGQVASNIHTIYPGDKVEWAYKKL